MANKETELASAKQADSRDLEVAKEKLKVAEEEVQKLQVELDQGKSQHHQTISPKEELTNKYHEDLAAAKAEAVKSYKAFEEYRNELMAAHEDDMLTYRASIRNVELLKELKRKIGQDLAFTVEKEPASKDDDQKDKATSSASKGQEGQDQIPS